MVLSSEELKHVLWNNGTETRKLSRWGFFLFLTFLTLFPHMLPLTYLCAIISAANTHTVTLHIFKWFSPELKITYQCALERCLKQDKGKILVIRKVVTLDLCFHIQVLHLQASRQPGALHLQWHPRCPRLRTIHPAMWLGVWRRRLPPSRLQLSFPLPHSLASALVWFFDNFYTGSIYFPAHHFFLLPHYNFCR